MRPPVPHADIDRCRKRVAVAEWAVYPVAIQTRCLRDP